MPDTLYLDTARLGQMATTAQRAGLDFVRFAGEEAGSMYFDEFLQAGSGVWPAGLRHRYPGLSLWQGVASLNQQLQQAAGAHPDSNVLPAGRSATLMQLAARLLFGHCRNVLVTDLTWPGYDIILKAHLGHERRRLTRVSVRRDILCRRVSVDHVVDKIVDAFRRNHCDGLFLPSVDNLGIRFPVAEVVRAIRATSELRFVVVDGAQAFCHVPEDLSTDICDFYIAGCHKWLRAFHPMGLGFFGRSSTKRFIERRVSQLLATGGIDDPLLAFTRELEIRGSLPFGETVNVAPLFSCEGALHDRKQASASATFSVLRENAEAVAEIVRATGCSPLQPAPAFRSGILLSRLKHGRLRDKAPLEIRGWFRSRHLAVSTYAGGIVRLSMPTRPLTNTERSLIATALSEVDEACSLRSTA